jgi:hypothetical protein
VKITTINTIEISSLCDNDCPYCPAQAQRDHRKVGFMSFETFKKAIAWVKLFCGQGSQRELNLFGVGEPMLHPDIVKFVKYARDMLPFRQDLHLNTNGNRMTPQLAQNLKAAGITAIDITAHNARSAAKTIRYFRQIGIKGQLSIDFITQPNNWAGQVDWFAPEYHKRNNKGNICPWLARGQIMVMSNGDITTCCIDAFATGVFGRITDDLTHLEFDSHALCKKCHHLTPAEYDILNSNAFLKFKPGPATVKIDNP